jgi:UDP-hydrolysing UDP-N-acetyl-D-glucosamine 2-epimerase
VRRLGVVTVARSDYGIYRPILKRLAERDDIELSLFVGGMHLQERFGSTVGEIEADGFPIAERVDFLVPGDTPGDVAASIGRGVVAFAEAFARTRPDILVLLGDRYEMLAAGVAALPLVIPLAHIHGGESTEGLIDEAIRHSLTKLSHLHFTATEVYARRVVQLGEEPWRVTVTGAPSLDAVRELQPLSDGELERLGVRLRGPTLLVTYHPLTLAPAQTRPELEALLAAIDASGLDAVFTYPNADTSHGEVASAVESFAASSERYALVKSLGSRAYFTLMRRVAAMVGNSSSGIIEASSFALPVVDVGSRQQGRVRPANVVHATSDRESIRAALVTATSDEFRRSLEGIENPYGDGHAAERIVERLVSVRLDERLVVKRFHDLRA